MRALLCNPGPANALWEAAERDPAAVVAGWHLWIRQQGSTDTVHRPAILLISCFGEMELLTIALLNVAEAGNT